MSSQNNCDCNDYAQLTANTGIGTVTDANPNLDGTGTSVTIFTAGSSGSVVKSVIVKATQPSQTGMVRLFIDNGTDKILYKEILIPVQPQYYIDPRIPVSLATLLQPMFVVYIVCDLELEDGDSIVATTQYDGEFNVIIEGVDRSYPVTPDVCCSFKQELPNTGVGMINTAVTNINAANVTAIFTADNNFSGSVIRSITIEALQSTNEGIIRFFISPDNGSTYYLMNEISIPETNQSAAIPAFRLVIPQSYNLQAGYIIGATTVTNQKFGITIQATKWTYPV